LFRSQQGLIDACEQIAKAKISLPNITFTGLSHFKHKVLYIDPVQNVELDALKQIARRSRSLYIFIVVRLHINMVILEICRNAYQQRGIQLLDTRPFTPHLTLLKLSKAPELYRQGIYSSCIHS
jgi:2'-5' RNA ligase